MAHMEATILDTNFNIVGIVDDYQSMIWTERYAEAGDFELYGAIGSTISKYCRLGYFVTIPESNRAMIIESIEFSQEVNESDKILVSGRSLEALLLRRIVWDQTILSGETYGKVQNAVKKLLTDNAIEPEDTNRAIPNLIFLDSTEEDITSLEFDSAQFTGNTLYDAVKQFADAFDIGFKIELFGTYLVFSLFAGKNRSFEQSTYNYVVYSSEYDNLLSSDFKQNITNFSNVALVAGEGEGSERRKIKYYYDFSEPSGMNRYELFVDARDISSTVDDGQGGSTQLTDQEYEYELANRGASKLAEVAEDYSFDAQIDTINSYQYGTDYFIGDILQLIDNMGNSGQFRITEFIRSMDSSGYSAYPQFKIISRMDSVIPVDLQGLPARVASLPDCADDMPLKDLVVGIEPKQAGSGDPSPSNPRPISGWDSVKVSATGKNLLDDSLKGRTGQAIYFGRDSGTLYKSSICLKAGSYTLSVTTADGTPSNLYMRKVGESTNVFSAYNVLSKSFTLTEGGEFAVWAYKSTYTSVDDITSAQIELGSTATAYEPYNGQTATITLPHTVYGAEHDVGSGVGSEEWGMIKLSDLDWTGIASNPPVFRAVLSSIPNIQAPASNTTVTTAFTESFSAMSYTAISSSDIGKFAISATISNRVVFIDNSVATLEEFLTKHGNDKLVYPLVTPTTYSATPTEITTQYGLNNIFADTGNINKVIYFKNKWR